jgi:cyanophycin synthetase
MSEQDLTLKVSTQLLGYGFGMEQQSVSILVTFTAPAKFSMEAATKALSNVFMMTAEDISTLLIPKGLRIPLHIEQFLQCSFALARSILQEGGFPAFSTEVFRNIENVNADKNTYSMTVNVPAIDNYDEKQIARAYGYGLSLVALLAKPDEAAFKAAADALLGKFILPMRQVLMRGISTLPVLREANKRGIQISYLGLGVFQLGTGKYARLIRKSSTDHDSAIGANIAQRKDISEILFKSVGAPVAETIVVQDSNAAVEAARKIGFPVVVKPANLDRSEGVFLDLGSDAEVRSAYEEARKLSPLILVQSRIPGHCHRLVAFGGRFVFGYSRLPAAVKGDGTKSIRELLNAFNNAHNLKAKHLQAAPLPFDDEAISCLSSQGLTLDNVLDVDQLAFLRTANMKIYAGHNEVITDRVHLENIALVERLAKFFRLESVGVDLVSPDPSRPWYENRAAITEINFAPQIGENTARANIEAMFPNGSRGSIPVECFVGGDRALHAARQRLIELANTETRAASFRHDNIDAAMYCFAARSRHRSAHRGGPNGRILANRLAIQDKGPGSPGRFRFA